MTDANTLNPPDTGRAKKPIDHHGRIRLAGRSIWPLLVLFWLAGAFWLIFLLYVCWSTLEYFPVTCEWKVLMPITTGVFLVAAFGFVLYTLHDLGRELRLNAVEEEPESTRRHSHIRHAYRNLGEDHRAHVRRTFFGVMSAFGTTLALLSFFYGRLEASAWLVGLAVIALALGLNRFWFK
jgi:hypothetical protein